MRLPHFFIDRPIFATVVSIVIVLLGVLSYVDLPVAQYPDVIPPTIVVNASFPGASPEVLADTVATPLEQEINGVENMLYMESSSTTNGRMTLTVTFKLGTDLDQAQVLVQNRVAVAEPRLPEEVRRIGVTTTKRSPDLLLVAHLLSPDNTFDQLYISNFAFLHVKDVLARVEGYDTAVYRLPEEVHAILFEHPPGQVLVATTKLSHFVTARYAPAEAWGQLWRTVLGWLQRDEAATRELRWTPAVRPMYGADDELPSGASAQAVRRGIEY